MIAALIAIGWPIGAVLLGLLIGIGTRIANGREGTADDWTQDRPAWLD